MSDDPWHVTQFLSRPLERGKHERLRWELCPFRRPQWRAICMDCGEEVE